MKRLLILVLATWAQLPAYASARTNVGVKAVCETEAILRTDGLNNEGQADDVAIWVHPTDPAKSRVIAAVKGAGVYVYDLQCKRLQTFNPLQNPNLPLEYINNIDLRYDVRWGNKTVDLAVGSDEEARQMFFFTISPDGVVEFVASPMELKPANGLKAIPKFVTHGMCMYKDLNDNTLYLISNQEDPGISVQWRVDADGSGKPTIQQVRQIFMGKKTITEACVADDEWAVIYITDEHNVIWKVPARPQRHPRSGYSNKVEEVGTKLMDSQIGGLYMRDSIEGMSIYYGPNGTGYLIAQNEADSGDGDHCCAAIFDRLSNNYIMSFHVQASGSIDALFSPDGLDVSNVFLGSNYPGGIFITHDDANMSPTGAEAGANFKFISWQDVVEASGGTLMLETGHDPRHMENLAP